MRLLTVILLSLFSLSVLTSATAAEKRATSISLSPVLDQRDLIKPATLIQFRNRIAGELTNHYNCTVLSRSNGAALLEEQRILAQSSKARYYQEYPPAADIWVAIQLLKKNGEYLLRGSYTPITGRFNEDVIEVSSPFSSIQDLINNGPTKFSKDLAASLELKEKTITEQTNQADLSGVWGSLPIYDLTNSQPTHSTNSDLLWELTERALDDAFPEIQTVDAEDIEMVASQYYFGATERKVGGIGNELGADYIIVGSLAPLDNKLEAQLMVVRVVDAAIIHTVKIQGDNFSSIQAQWPSAIYRLAHGISSNTERLPASTEAATIEECQLILQFHFFYSAGRNRLENAEALELLLGVAMLGQDLSIEEHAYMEMPSCIQNDWNPYRFLPNWQTVDISKEDDLHNQRILDILESAIERSPAPTHLLFSYADALLRAGKRKASLEVLTQGITNQQIFPKENDVVAACYLSALSLNNRFEEADQFYQSLPDKFTLRSLYYTAALHYRRAQQPAKELNVYLKRLTCKKYQGTVASPARTAMLLDSERPAQERVNYLNMLKPNHRGSEQVQWVLAKSYSELGDHTKARELASSLLQRSSLETCGFSSESEFRRALSNIAGNDENPYTWKNAKELIHIEPRYKMYIQPVGTYSQDILNDAAALASTFMGCKFIIRPEIPAPSERSVFSDELNMYDGRQLLRHLTQNCPTPKDAIYHVYLVERRIWQPSEAYPASYHNSELGVAINYDFFEYCENRQDLVDTLAKEFVRSFRFFVEDALKIPSEQRANIAPCLNSQTIAYRKSKRRWGYCNSCADIYKSMDTSAVYNFVQSQTSD